MNKFLSLFALIALFAISTNAQTIDDAFFTPVNYRGAFDGVNDWTAGWSEFDPRNKVYAAATDTLGNGNTTSGTPFEITTNVTLSASRVYLLRGWIYVANGGTLTIPAGTVLRGDKTTVATIIVERGGKIIANGTATNPIVFTSNQAVGNRNAGDWGGIIILGNAPTNRIDPKIEGGPRSIYGGTNPNDNSGSLSYVRLEFPGVAFAPNQEINGLTLGGVGAGTNLDHLQVSFSGDDSYEWFGGTVNAKYLIAYKAVDDDFDTDFGFAGRVQFAVTLRDPSIADVSGSNAFESDNYNPGINASNPTADAPYTTAVFSNVTALGPLGVTGVTPDAQFQHGAHLRRNTRQQMHNIVFAGFPRGIQIQDAAVDNARGNTLKLTHSVIVRANNFFFVTASDTSRNWRAADEAAYFLDPARGNDTLTNISQAGFSATAFAQTGRPNFLLTSTSELLRGSYWDKGTPSTSTIPSIDDAYFTRVNYRGAFDGTNDWTANWAEFDPRTKVYGAVTDTLGNGNTTSGTPFEITTNVTLDKNKVYLIRGWVYVTNGGTLTIPAGTVIRGDKTTVGTIIVERGGKINANGTAAEPIVFTSNQAVGNRNAGDWGGIIILGKAPVNRIDPKIEGGPRSIYGGTDPNDNSGVMRYVRLEFPGVAFAPNQEINGLTLGGVGAGTQIDYIQVSFSGDDSFEWFGGTVNSKYLIAYKAVDDDFDTDFGFAGRVQFAMTLRDPSIADVSGSNAFESDNYNPGINASNPAGDAPYTTAVFSNVSAFGPLGVTGVTPDPQFQHGAHLRRNTRLQIHNTLFAGFPRGIQIQDAAVDNARNNTLKLTNNVIVRANNFFFVTAADTSRNWRSANEAAYFLDSQRENDTLTNIAQAGFTNPFLQTGKPNFLLAGTSILLRGSYWDNGIGTSAVPSIEDPFFTPVSYRGAFDGANDWTAGWSEFDPRNKVYAAITDTLGNGNTTSGTPFQITTSVTLDKSKVYLLRGWVYVANGGTLTIPAGTVIRGDKTTVGTIIVEPGGKIFANGTAAEPIVFTSNQSVGNRNAGDWGGIIMLGKAPTNRIDPKIEGGPRTIYGGTDPNDNSGILKYVRLEFPGVAFAPNQEINGLTLGGVGAGTQIDYIQVSFCGDDSYEWFGGTVNSKYLIAYKAVDDDFDTDFGFAGRVQFAVTLRDPSIADVSGSNAFESDNYNPGINASNPTADAPYTTAVFSNVTALGPLGVTGATPDPQFQHGAHLRRNTRLQIYNTILAGFPRGIQIQDAAIDNARNGFLKLENNVIAGSTTPFFVTAADTARNWRSADEQAFFLTPAFENQTLTIAQLAFTNAFAQTGRPNFLLGAGSPLLRGSYWDGLTDVKVIPAAQVNIKVFPNPTADVVYFETDVKIKTVLVSNIMGQVVRQINVTDNNISMDGLSMGTYVLVFVSEDNKLYSQRVVKR